MYTIIPLKHCSKCNKDYFPTTKYFHRNKNRPDKLSIYCKACNKAYQRPEASAEIHKQQNRAAYWTHIEEVREYHRTYNIVNHKRISQHKRGYYETHRQQNNTIKLNRIARERNAPGSHTAQDIQKQYERQKGKCYWCGNKLIKYHVDHIIPLIRGGSNWPDNLVLACPHCNLSKNNKLPHEWPEGGRLL